MAGTERGGPGSAVSSDYDDSPRRRNRIGEPGVVETVQEPFRRRLLFLLLDGFANRCELAGPTDDPDAIPEWSLGLVAKPKGGERRLAILGIRAIGRVDCTWILRLRVLGASGAPVPWLRRSDQEILLDGDAFAG